MSGIISQVAAEPDLGPLLSGFLYSAHGTAPAACTTPCLQPEHRLMPQPVWKGKRVPQAHGLSWLGPCTVFSANPGGGGWLCAGQDIYLTQPAQFRLAPGRATTFAQVSELVRLQQGTALATSRTRWASQPLLLQLYTSNLCLGVCAQ